MIKRILIVLPLIILVCCRGEFRTGRALKHVERQMRNMRTAADLHQAIPRSVTPAGEIHWTGNSLDWTEGFWPGICWMLFQFSDDTLWRHAAEVSQNRITGHRSDSSTHDLGFIFNNSFGKAYRITGEEVYRNVLIDAANSLVSRYDPTTGCIKSWDWAADRWQYPVIIDNMMNLELLFEVSGLTGDTRYEEIAIRHANTTLRNHFRSDFSSFHVVDYDTLSGEVIRKMTHQGFSDSSSWARGQSWGLYGFTLCYRFTGDSAYLEQAQRIAGYILDHLPDDGVPIWDYSAPDSLKIYRDASAGAILASALIELAVHTGNNSYLTTATTILKTLGNDYYRTPAGKNTGLVLKHSVGSYPEKSEVDVPLVYADYYYIEALLRLDRLKNKLNCLNVKTDSEFRSI